MLFLMFYTETVHPFTVQSVPSMNVDASAPASPMASFFEDA